MDNIPEHSFDIYGKGFYVCCPKCNKSSWMQSKTTIDCGRCGYNVGATIMKNRNYFVVGHGINDDGTIDLSLKDEKSQEVESIEAIPNDKGYQVKIFNRDIGTMDVLMTLKTEKPEHVEDPRLTRIINCVIDILDNR